MAITIKQGNPQQLNKEVSSIVEDCFEGVWSHDDLVELIKIPHESETFMVVYDDNKPVGYAYVVADYVESVDLKISTIQEMGLLPDYRETDIVEQLLDNAITFSKANNAEIVEQQVTSLDQWLIPKLISKNMIPSEIRADREISTSNEAKLILENLKKNPKLNIIMNQLYFEQNDELESHIVDSDQDLDEIPRNDPIAFGSIISVEKAEELENTLNELYNIDIEWDEIGITFDYKI